MPSSAPATPHMLKLQRLHLLSVAALLLISSTFLPGGLLPHVQHLRHVAAAASSPQVPRPIVTRRALVADLRVDSSGMLLHPQCDAANHSFAATSLALVHVQCALGRAETTRGPGGRFGALGLPIAAAGKDTRKLFCGDSERAHLALQCLPVLVRAIRELEPHVYTKYVAPTWLRVAGSGLPLCCSESEEEKPLPLVDLTKCGVPCDANLNATAIPTPEAVVNDSSLQASTPSTALSSNTPL